MNKAIQALGNQHLSVRVFSTLDDLEQGEDFAPVDLDVAGAEADLWASSALYDLRRALRAGRITEVRFDELLARVTEIRRALWDARVAA